MKSVLEARHSTGRQQDSHSPYLLPGDPGLTLPWTLSQVFLRLMGTVILTIVNCFSKAVHFIALPKLPTALETSSILVDQVFLLHGIATDILSDRGPQFTSQDWRALAKALGASVSLSSGYHPQSNDQAERANQDQESALRCVATSNPSSWSQHLPWVEYAHNTLMCYVTGLSPFEASPGYQPSLLPLQEQELAVPSIQQFLPECP